MKISHVLFWGLMGVACVLWDVSIAPFLPGFRWIEPFLPILLFFALFRPSWSAFLFGGVVAIFIDLYQLADIPALTIFTVVYLSVLTLLTRHVLTNRSFYSAFALLMLGRLVGFLLGWLSHGTIGLWNPAMMVPHTFSQWAARLGFDIALLLIVFLLSARFQRTLRSSPTVGGLVGYF